MVVMGALGGVKVADRILDRVVGLLGSKLTNHQKFVEAFKHRGGEELTAAEIKTIILRKFPDMNPGSILPSDHTERKVKAAACWCAGTDKRIFDRIRRDLYRVRPNL